MAGRKTHELASRVVVGFQNPNTQRSGIAATVFEEVALGPMNLGLEVPEIVERTRTALALLHIESIQLRDPARLSGGQAQLVAIAALLAMRPRHVILDEPTAQLDPAGTRLVGEALRQLAAGGTSLLIAEHKTDLLDGVCSRIVAIDAGRIALDGPAGDVLADPRLEAIGVQPPSRVRLTRALDGAGIDAAHRGGRGRGDGGGRVIEVEDLVHVYPGGTRAVDGVSLRIEAGERVAIVGQNGSGKSTLVRHFNGLLRPTEGRVLVDGVDAATLRVAELAAKVGLAFQDPDRQIFSGKVRSEVAFGPRNMGVAKNQVGSRVDEALAAAGLERRRRREPVRPGLLAPEAARAGLDPRDADAGRRPRRADDRSGRARRRPRPGDRRRTRGAGPDGRRDQPRHARSSPSRSSGSSSCATAG